MAADAGPGQSRRGRTAVLPSSCPSSDGERRRHASHARQHHQTTKVAHVWRMRDIRLQTQKRRRTTADRKVKDIPFMTMSPERDPAWPIIWNHADDGVGTFRQICLAFSVTESRAGLGQDLVWRRCLLVWGLNRHIFGSVSVKSYELI